MTDLVHLGRQLDDLLTEQARLQERLGQVTTEIESWRRYAEHHVVELLAAEHPDAAQEYDEARGAAEQYREALAPLCREAATHVRAVLSVLERIRPVQATLKGAVERQREAVAVLERTVGRNSGRQRPPDVDTFAFALPVERGRSPFHSLLTSLEAAADAHGA